MIYKALIIDVDGTLISSIDAMPSKKVKEAIMQLQTNKNLHISLATARPFKNIKKICKELQLSGYAIVSGGAQLVDVQTGNYYYEYPLDPDHTLAICRLIKVLNSDIRVWIQDNGIDYVFEDFYKPNKPFVIVAYALTETLADEIIQKLSHIAGFFYTKVSSREKGLFDINITCEKATKKQGLETLAQIWGISKDEIIAIGDGYNDVPMLQAAGLKIAMGNAVDEVKRIADYIAPSVENDGLAITLQKYLNSSNSGKEKD